jgi:LmbE family N-acetylglucosaminyl deacetylase
VKVLAIGAHPDDIELGCAGALLRHVAAGDEVTMLVMTPGEMGPQGLTSRVREQEAAAAVIGANLVWGPFADGSVPSGRAAVAAIDEIVTRTGADVIYAHAPNDTHQDHVATSLAALSSGRRLARVLFYQAPSTTSFNPTLFIDIERTLGDKLASLRSHWSQVMQCSMVDLEAVEAGARYWGSRAKISYAEAFETPRFVWDIETSSGAKTSSVPVETSAADDLTGKPADQSFITPGELVYQGLAGART